MTGLLELVEEVVLRFMERDFQEESVKVEVVSGGLKIFLEESYIELMKGSEYALPRWLAYKLQEQGVCKVKDLDVTLEKLSQLVYLEESYAGKLQLSKLNGYFYTRLKRRITELENKVKTAPDWRIYADELKTFMEFYDSLTRERVRKIVNFLHLIDIPQEISEKLSEEEKVLYSHLKTVFDIHRKNLSVRGGHGGPGLKG
ncbi:MAG: hypothetical protein QXP68_02670 [Thermosphaera sp.]